MKETPDRETVQSVFSELEEQHTDMIDSYYSFHNGLILLKQCLHPSSRYPIAPDCEIPNSIIRGFWKEEKYEEEEDTYVADYHVGFISSKEYLIKGSSGDAVKGEVGPGPGLGPGPETESLKEKNRKLIFQKRAMKSKQTSKHKRISEISKGRNKESSNPLFIDFCNRLFNEQWFPESCEVEFNAIVDQLAVCLGKAVLENHKNICDYILECNSLKKMEASKIVIIGDKLTNQLSHESNPTMIMNCMQAIGSLNLKSDINISLIKPYLKSASVHLRKAAKDALRAMGVRQTSVRYAPQESSSAMTVSSTVSEEPQQNLQMSDVNETPSETKKVLSKESKSRTKLRSAKDTKGKKSKGKRDVSPEKPSPAPAPAPAPVDDAVEDEFPKDDAVEDKFPKDDAVEDEFPEDDAVEDEFPKDDGAVEDQFPEEPELETIVQDTEEPDLEAIVKADEEPVLENVEYEEEEEEEVAEEVMSISPEVLQEANDLSEDTQVESIEEKQEDFSKEDFVEEEQTPEIPTEETEVLLDTDTSKLFPSSDEIVQQTEDHKEIPKVQRVEKKKKKNLDFESISVKKSPEVPEYSTKKDLHEQKEVKFEGYEADEDFSRTSLDKKDSIFKGKQSRLLKRMQSPKFFPRKSHIKENKTAGELMGSKVAAKTQAARNQATILKQKQRHERDLQNKDKITKLFDAKKGNYFLTKDSNKTTAATDKKPIFTKRPAKATPVDKLRSSLLPFSKGGRGYDNFVKELNSIDKLPKRITLRVQRPKSMLGPIHHISSTDYQASMQVKIESAGVQANATTAIPPPESLLPAFSVATLPFESSVTAFRPVRAATSTVIPPAASAVLPPATTSLFPGAAAALLPGSTSGLLSGTAGYIIPQLTVIPLSTAPNDVIFGKYSDQELVSQENEVPGENEAFSWTDGVLYGQKMPSEEGPQKLSKTLRRSQRKKEIDLKKTDLNKEWAQKLLSEKEWKWPEDGEKKIVINSSKEWARKFTEREYGFIDDIGTMKTQRREIADTEKKIDSNKKWAQKLLTEEEWRCSEDADSSKKREPRQKDMLDMKEFALTQRWIEKPDYSSIHKAFPDPSVSNLPVMMGSKYERQWLESDDWNKKRACREKVIPEREEEYLMKNWSHALPWSKTSSVSDRRLAEVKDAERELGWSETAGSRIYQKSPTNLSNLEWSDKAFYPVDKLSPWMRYHLQYKPERIEEEIDASNFELKNVSQTPPEWFPKYKRMLFSPEFYLQREKWINDYRRPTSIIY